MFLDYSNSVYMRVRVHIGLGILYLWCVLQFSSKNLNTPAWIPIILLSDNTISAIVSTFIIIRSLSKMESINRLELALVENHDHLENVQHGMVDWCGLLYQCNNIWWLSYFGKCSKMLVNAFYTSENTKWSTEMTMPASLGAARF